MSETKPVTMSEPHPEIELRIESQWIGPVVPKLQPPPKLDDLGWPIYTVTDEATGRERYDDRYWPRDAQEKLTCHRPVTDIKPGMKILWKGTLFDYHWSDGVIVERDDQIYVESPHRPDHFGFLKFCDVLKLWVTTGACFLPSRDLYFTG